MGSPFFRVPVSSLRENHVTNFVLTWKLLGDDVRQNAFHLVYLAPAIKLGAFRIISRGLGQRSI